ncbi:DUF2058 domain-containing protein [Marinomonas algicola]|uniref:DUF2058 domain-containing protein n=1 Tax=Marinomonas algicola TaxID=2773454 RepID=UPI0019D57B57|nr:DUF2058 domain-containing protein [Marinomonas algicola]
MAKSLQEQLMKAGLVDKKKVKKLKAEKLQHKQKVKNGKATAEDENLKQQELKKQRDEKAEKDRLLNLQKEEAAFKRAVQAQIRQIIEMNRIPKEEGDIAYHFKDNKKVKQLYISQQMHNQLAAGQLAIVKLDDKYELVAEPVAVKISQRDDSYVLVCNDRVEDIEDEDDPYADFKIPDDLMW